MPTRVKMPRCDQLKMLGRAEAAAYGYFTLHYPLLYALALS